MQEKNSIQTGKSFEHSFAQAYQWYAIKHHITNEYDKKFMDVSSPEEDMQEGTDIYDGEIRIDITMNFENKDHMAKIFKKSVCLSQRLPYIHYGIRIGNNHRNKDSSESEHLFHAPVLVVGITLDAATYRKIHEQFMDAVYDHIDEIVEVGEDLYYAYIDGEAC